MAPAFGFDISPRLSASLKDSREWAFFIRDIQGRYRHDERVKLVFNYMELIVGEHKLVLPFEGQKFLRLGLKDGSMNGDDTWNEKVKKDIVKMYEVAKLHFDDRIHALDGGDSDGEQSGHYTWEEVDKSIKSYSQRDETTPSTIDLLTRFGIARPLNPPYTITTIAGKGKALIATRPIAAGKAILYEQPLLYSTPSSTSTELEITTASNLKRLSRTQQRAFLSLHNIHAGKLPFSGIVHTNAFPCGFNSSIYSILSRINHTCLPNANITWNEETAVSHLYAITPIAAGHEITISYIHGSEPSTIRKQILNRDFSFECTCPLCTSSPENLKQSDLRRLRIRILDLQFRDLKSTYLNPKATLLQTREILTLLQDEYAHAAVCQSGKYLGEVAAVCGSHGDFERARVFARKAWRDAVTVVGEEHPYARKCGEVLEGFEGDGGEEIDEEKLWDWEADVQVQAKGNGKGKIDGIGEDDKEDIAGDEQK